MHIFHNTDEYMYISTYIQAEVQHTAPAKNDDLKTILSFWDSVTLVKFQGVQYNLKP